jgi:hypothetical protein
LYDAAGVLVKGRVVLLGVEVFRVHQTPQSCYGAPDSFLCRAAVDCAGRNEQRARWRKNPVRLRVNLMTPMLISGPKRRLEGIQTRGWRRGSESNRRIKVLQTSPLPLGYRALKSKLSPDAQNVYRLSRGKRKAKQPHGLDSETCCPEHRRWNFRIDRPNSGVAAPTGLYREAYPEEDAQGRKGERAQGLADWPAI